jgi:hypothetical protein
MSTTDLQLLAGVLVTSMIAITEQVIELPPRGEGMDEVIRMAEKQLRLVLLGASIWRSAKDPFPDT